MNRTMFTCAHCGEGVIIVERTKEHDVFQCPACGMRTYVEKVK